MKFLPPLAPAACLALLTALAALPPRTSAQEEKVFKGVLADSQCAMNVHSLSQSHKEMLEGKSVGKTDADCVWYCVTERGGRFVLQTPGRIYKLDKQDLSKDFAARKVVIRGALDEKTSTIHVTSIDIEK